MDKGVVWCDEWVYEKIEVFSTGLAMWRKWRMTGLLRGSMQGNVMVVTQWVGYGRWINTVKDCLKKRFAC